MKKWTVLILVVLAVECGGVEHADKGFFSDFIIVNDSDYLLLVSYSIHSPEGEVEETQVIEVDEKSLFFQDANLASSISGAPSPESTFIELRLSVLSGENQIITDDRSGNEYWTKEVEDSLTIYSLSVANNEFQ